MCKISAIERYCRRAAAGIRKLELFVPDEVSATPAPYLDIYTQMEPTMKPGKSSLILLFDRFSCSLQSIPDNNGQPGDFWTHRIQCSIQRNRPEVGLLKLRMRNRNFHIITEDYYGERMWWPSLRLAASRSVEEQLSGRNAFSFAFSRRWQHPGIYLKRNENAPVIGANPWSDTDGSWSDSNGPWIDS